MITVPIAAPPTDERVVNAAVEVVRSGVWTNGPQTAGLEEEFRAYCGATRCVAVSSGTAALVLIGQALGFEPEDRVLVPSFTFAATANAFLSLGCAVECIDVDPVTFNMDPERLRTALYRPARAVVFVDLYGNTAGTDELIDLAHEGGALVVEDAAQAHGARDASGARAGSRARVDVTAFSLYATKNLAAGEGGLVTCDDHALADRLLELRSHGAAATYVHRRLGLNHRLTEVAAAMARAQLPDLDLSNRRRVENAHRLDTWCRDAWGDTVRLPVRGETTHVLHQYTVVFDSAEQRDEILAGLRAAGVDARIFYPYTIPELPGVHAADAPVATSLRDRVLSLPVHPRLNEEQLDILRGAITSRRPR